ncbi:hypothetical protein OH492_23765 [Vibrio chagasii]|nr:hypothetical protein [Vibrio chagasii]
MLETVKPFSTSLIRIDELITRDKIAAAKVNGAGCDHADKEQRCALTLRCDTG